MSRARYFDTSDVYIYFHDFIITLEIGEENFQKKKSYLYFFQTLIFIKHFPKITKS